MNYEFFKGQFILSLFSFDDETSSEEQILFPLIHMLSFFKKKQFEKILLKSLISAYDKFLHELDSKEFQLRLGAFLLSSQHIFTEYSLSQISRIFGFKNLKEKTSLVPHLKHTLTNAHKKQDIKAFIMACEIIRNCELWGDFDFPSIIEIATSINGTSQLLAVVEDNKKLTLQLLSYLNPAQNKASMKKIILKYQLDPRKYPELLNYMREGLLKHLLREFGYEKVEDFFQRDPEDFAYFLNHLEKKQNFSLLNSVVRRKEHLLSENQRKKYEKYSKLPYVENKFLDHDFFGPASQLIN